MSIISFDSNLFNINMVNGDIESPENIRTKMVKAILDKCPENGYVVTNHAYTTSIEHDNKKINVSVWKFNLKDLIANCPLNCFVESGYDFVIAWNIQFFDNDALLSDINQNANITCAMGYVKDDENRTLFMLGTKAMMFARTLGDSVKLFFADTDPMVDIVADAIPVVSVNKTKAGFSGTVLVKDYKVTLSFRNGELVATIPHKYTMNDEVYGMRFSNYSKLVKFANEDDVRSFNWDALWDDLYEHRNGTCTYCGSLGS